MKQLTKRIIYAIVWLMMAMSFGSFINVCQAEQMRGRTIIIVQRPTTPTGNAPRGDVYVPFYAELTNLGVLLSADADWGDATVTLYSLEGDYYQTTFDMADVSIMLPVNGNVGDSYTLTIAVENGLEYEGEFYL